MAEARLSPDPAWLELFEECLPGEDENADAALGIAYVKGQWPGGEAQARAHVDRAFKDCVLQIEEASLDRACKDPARTPAEVRVIARRIAEIRATRAA